MRTMLLALGPLLSLAGAFAATAASAATWTVASPVGGDGAALVARAPSGVVYAIPGDGLTLFRSDDRGGSWIQVTLPVPPSPSLPVSIAAAGAGVYLDYQRGNVARSADGGATWSFRKLPGRSVRIVPGPGTRIYVVRGLACCVGGAFTFHLPPGGEPPIFMAADRSTGIVYTDRGSTRDLGAHWRRYAANPLAAGGGHVWAVRGVEQFRRRELLTGTGTGPLHVLKRRMTVRESPVSMVVVVGALVAVGADGRVRRSTDGGRTWITRPAGAPACASGIAADGNVIYVDGGAYPCPDQTGQHGVWRSSDGGLHWSKTASVTGTHVAAGAGRVAIADGGAVRVSSDGGAWDLLPVLPDSATVAAILLPTAGGLLVLDDNGLIWQEG